MNAMRVAAGLSPMTFTDSSLSNVKVKAVHVIELRTSLNAARSAIGVGTIVFVDPTLTVIKAVHLQQLRDGTG